MFLNYIYYLLGYEDIEVKADEKQVKQRDLLHRQLRYTKKVVLKTVDKKIPVDMTSSCYLQPAIPVGRIYTKEPTSWSKVVEKKQNRFSVLEDEQQC